MVHFMRYLETGKISVEKRRAIYERGSKVDALSSSANCQHPTNDIFRDFQKCFGGFNPTTDFQKCKCLTTDQQLVNGRLTHPHTLNSAYKAGLVLKQNNSVVALRFAVVTICCGLRASHFDYTVKAKFHHASWFEAGRRPASNQIA